VDLLPEFHLLELTDNLEFASSKVV